MSGFASVVSFGGAVVDREAFAKMRALLARTAPDGGSEQLEGAAAFAYAHFNSDPERPTNAMPLTLGGRTIVGDLRLDERDALRDTLGLDATVDDATLVLHAYARWGRDCVAQLTGDFAFLIWDASTREIFAARDPFGVKPFYYAYRDQTFIASSALGALRLHPLVRDLLDDDAIADFLLFSIVRDPQRTTFADIRTLPAGHTMRVRADGLQLTRWWTLPIEEPLRFRGARDVVDAFNEQLTRAVADRIAGPSIAVSMSGGLDSSSIATVADEVLRARHGEARILAQTIVFDPLVPDDEERFALAVARALGIEHEIIRADERQLFAKWGLPEYVKDEPSNDPFSSITTDQFRRAAQFAPVMLSGQGGDAVFYASHPYFYDLLRRGRLVRFATEIAGFTLKRGKLPPLCLRSSFRRARGVQPARAPLPDWLAPAFVRELRLEQRWNDYWNEELPVHPTRPQAYNHLNNNVGWQRLNEYTDAAAMHVPLVYRNPFLDVRLVRFLLRVPPMPWFAEKELLREATRGRLPELTRTRRKTPIGMDPAHIWMTRQSDELCEMIASMPFLDRWIDRDRASAAIRSRERTLYDSFLLSLLPGIGLWRRGG
jgi:asparagine synthase (glutamine-hydrolysing)